MKIFNRSASYDYTILDRFEAGIKLTGAEVKSVKGGHVSLTGSFVKLMGTEAFLINSKIEPYSFAKNVNYDPQRTRKLLLHKREVISLLRKMDSANLTLVPVSMYLQHGLVKVEVALAKGKKQYEKRESIKKREDQRLLDRQFRGKVK
jgi:SsrA-binding protein